jgi:hypothetical protein
LSKTIREQLWSNIKEKIKFLDGIDEEFVKNVTFICIGRLFHRWKLDLNRKYMKKQLVPKYMAKITQAQWKQFVKQKTNPKALPISDKFAEISKKNIYLHHLRSNGYVGKITKWDKKLEEIVSADKPNPL